MKKPQVSKTIAEVAPQLQEVAPEPIKAVEEELSEALNLRELDLKDPATQETISRQWPNLDKYTRTVLWPTWQDSGGHVCLKCGHVVVADTGLCAAEPTHKYRTYPNGYAATRITFH